MRRRDFLSLVPASVALGVSVPGQTSAKPVEPPKLIGENYISTGSLYLCTVGMLTLGLPASDPFWAAPSAEWTSVKLWKGIDFPTDHAISNLN